MVSHGVASERLSAERDGCACLSNAGTRNPLQTLVDLCDLCLPENKEIFRLDRLISSARSAGVEATRDTADDGALNHVEQRDSADQHDNEDKKQSANIIIKNTRRRASAPRNAKKKALLHLSLDPTSRRAGPPDIKESASKTAINRMPVTPSTPNTMTTRSSKMKTRSGCPLSPLDSIASPFPATQALVSKNEREDDEGHCEDVSLDAPVPFKLRLVVKGDKAKKSGDKARRLDTSPTLLNESPRQGLLVENIALNRNGIGSKSIDFTETRSTRSTLKSAVGVTLETPEIVHALDQTNIMSKSVFGFIPGRRVQISDSIGQWWPARMVSLEKGRILCRYDGWGEEHDEWIDSESRSMRDMQESDVTESMAILTETVSSQSYRSSKATLDSERPPPKKKKRIVKNLRLHCRVGSTVQVLGPDGWQVGKVIRMTPFRIQVRYQESWLQNFEEWVLFSADMVRFPPDEDDLLQDARPPLNDPAVRLKEEEEKGDSKTWIIYCNQCQHIIERQRYYCSYCESPSESYDLCIHCFQKGFRYHQHPRSSFAVESLIHDVSQIENSPGFVEDRFDLDFQAVSPSPDSDDQQIIDNGSSICAFCNDDSEAIGPFIGPHPFLLPLTEKKKAFWAHERCARLSPEVVHVNGRWFNVSEAMRRGRNIRCAGCKQRGATLGCFEPSCTKSYHVLCTSKPLKKLEEGLIFWCVTHEAKFNRVDDYEDVYSCDRCGCSLGIDNQLVLQRQGCVNRDRRRQERYSWFTCGGCASHFSSFDLCPGCFQEGPGDHSHPASLFVETNIQSMREAKLQESQKLLAFMKTRKAIASKLAFRKTQDSTKSDSRCTYCWTQIEAMSATKGHNDALLCQECFRLAPKSFNTVIEPVIGDGGDDNEQDIELLDRYLVPTIQTRGLSQKTQDPKPKFEFETLETYGPLEEHLFSMFIDTSYFDVPRKAPRWATHGGMDYHGTWLPQIVRWSLLRYTNKGDRVLSNFLGRGTDAIECLLLERKCVGVDVNPVAVKLARKNTSFRLPKDGSVTMEFRPLLLLGDSRHLDGGAFQNESFDHVLSHPPYKDCVAYSTDIEGDVSRFPLMDDFQREIALIASASWRVLKWNGRCTLAIGDNRRDCFYQPVSFQTCETYMKQGFEIEELILKRQRNCQTAFLGAFICGQHDFLRFTHEHVVIFRKVKPKERSKFPICRKSSDIQFHSVHRKIPNCPIERNSVVLGTIWNFKVGHNHTLSQLAISKIVERFGRDDTHWEEVVWDQKKILSDTTYSDNCEERDEPGEYIDILEDDNIVDYERERLLRIRENKKQLLGLGLATNLVSDETDEKYTELLYASVVDSSVADGSLAMIVVPPLETESTAIFKNDSWVSSYRKFILEQAARAAEFLLPDGLFVVVVKDCRAFTNSSQDETRHIPLSVLVCQDVWKGFLDKLKLKDYIGIVPDGYARDMDADFGELKLRWSEDVVEWQEEKQKEAEGSGFRSRRVLPIVHLTFLCFQKISARFRE